VFKTTDGGKTWKRVFFVNDRLGVIDLVMNSQNPNVLYAATYDMQRTPWMHRNAGPDSGIHKTTDGGATWTKLTGGLPTGRIGQIGLDISLRNAEVVSAAAVPARPDSSPTSSATSGRCGLTHRIPIA
jgi:hypothetical protein